MFVEPITFTGKYALLEPLAIEHLADLQFAAADGELWNLWYTSVPKPDEAAAHMQFRLSERARGTMMPFIVRRAADGCIVGATAFCNIVAVHRRLEIGYTWYSHSVQRTAINTEVKLMMLQYAFEALDCIAVDLCTHHMNLASRAAIERLGARLDGVLRSNGIDRRGTIRDTYSYSIIAPEWPAVKQNLLRKLGCT